MGHISAYPNLPCDDKKAIIIVFNVKHILISFEMRERWLFLVQQMIGSQGQLDNGIGCG